MRSVLIAAGWAALASARLASADDRATPGVVTEAAFLAALDGPASLTLAEGLSRAQAAERQAALLSNPRLDFEREAPEGNPVQGTWSLTWTPPLDGRRGLTRDASRAGVSSARARLAADRLTLRSQLRSVFAAWALAESRSAALSEITALVSTSAARARTRADAGEESGLSARRLALAASEFEADLARAQAEALRAAATARGWKPDLPAQVHPQLPDLPPPPVSLEAEASRPEVEALRHEFHRTELEARLARRWIGFPELRAGWQTLSPNGSTASGPVLGVGWTVPLFDRGQPAREETAQRQASARARLEIAEARARADAEGTRAAYARLAKAAAAARDTALTDTRIVEGAEAAYRAGESSLTDLLDTLRAVRDARLRALEMLDSALTTHRELELVLGRALTEGDLP